MWGRPVLKQEANSQSIAPSGKSWVRERRVVCPINLERWIGGPDCVQSGPWTQCSRFVQHIVHNLPGRDLPLGAIDRGLATCQDFGMHVVVYMNPNTATSTMEDALDHCAMLEAAGVHLAPCSFRVLARVGSLFELYPCLTVDRVKYELDLPTDLSAKVLSYALVERLPLVSIYTKSSSRDNGDKGKRMTLLYIHHEDTPMYIVSLLSLSAGSWRSTSAFHDGDLIEEDELMTDAAEHDIRSAPRRSLTAETPLGQRIISFIQSFIHTRGQMQMGDGSRMRPSMEVIGAPLRTLEAAARRTFGMVISRETIRKFFRKKRRDAVNTDLLGLIDARPGTIREIRSCWHPRVHYSSRQIKLAKEFLVSMARLGCKVLQMGADGKAKTPIWTPCNAHTGTLGFLPCKTAGFSTATTGTT